MMMFLMMVAAAATTQPLEPAAEADMRCVAAMLYAVGSAAETKDDKSAGLLIASVSYYVGRLDARQPGVDYAGHIGRLAKSAEFEKQLPGEIKRCAAESGAAMQAAGKAAQTAGE